MKTYSIIYAFVALMVIGCSKSNDPIEIEIEQEEDNFSNADYTLLQGRGGILSSQPLSATKEHISFGTTSNSFEETPIPEISVQKGTIFAYYRKLTDCSGSITLHNFKEDVSTTIDVFEDLVECTLEVTSIEVEGDLVYISYLIQETSKIDKYYVRVIDMGTAELGIIDVELDKKPLQIAYANNRLFILTIDWEITDENSLSVLDCETKTLINEIGLGYDVSQIITTPDENIVISYPELHTLLNSTTMAKQYINYENGKEPKFHASRFNYMDGSGKLYYKMPTEDNPHPNIPAIYDFTKDLTVLYYYENFLTSSELESEFEIGDTTLVSYDQENHIMLVGYQKKSDDNKGGLLRVQLEPELVFLDNINLNAVPYHIFYE